MSQTKQVIVVRRDLEMPPGKLAAQVAHASIAFLTRRLEKMPLKRSHLGDQAYKAWLMPQEQEWIEGRFTKVVLGVDDLETLQAIAAEADAMHLEAHVIQDAGFTVFTEPTITCVGIGPDKVEAINAVTGELSLY